MINWKYIRENHPKALSVYMARDWTLEEFWKSYEIYVNLRIIENELGFELYDLKINSKLVIYSSLCYKTIMKDGIKIRVVTFNDYQEKKVNKIFKLIDDQIKNKNYLNN